MQIDSPEGANQGYYRVGRSLDAAGQVTGGWSPWIAVPDWFAWENQGAGIAIADLDGNGRPALVVFQVDSPAGLNAGYYRVGWNLDADGQVTGGWSEWMRADWFSWENQGAGIAITDLDGNGRPNWWFSRSTTPPMPTRPPIRSAGTWMLKAGSPAGGAPGLWCRDGSPGESGRRYRPRRL